VTELRAAIKEFQVKFWSKDKRNRRKPEHPVVVATFDPLAKIVASTVQNSEESSVLDVGCGNGFLQWALEKIFGEVVGLDYSQKMLEVNPCRRKYLGCSTKLPFADMSFDVVVASSLLHHLTEADRVQTVSEMQRVARYAVVSFEPNRNNLLIFLFALIKKEERMALKFSPAYMRKLFRSAGFSFIQIFVRGWIVPNKAPIWWLPVGNFLENTLFQKLGFDICSIALKKKSHW